MPPKIPHCPVCQIPMDEGFLLERGHGNVAKPTQWVDGAPEPSFWTGTRTRGKEKYRVTTYRCDRCGYLLSFAVEPG